ncbi:2-isopropylmalate synthase [[Mycobacterium] nativiensis]|uniref:Homocitrate synthase n=1 Tax=[Mycobacterium] nativiensis TaxID=2855503 RepID=A0ABU5Y1P9_9MYCO|nr:homocitrate synthase [Mycolicibacter sp. MYC340]MEB3034143.1 homocitrate synthase [Mycolicibacter sp. MYC340]
MTTTSFADQFEGRLPRGLRDQAARLSWDGFVATYGRAKGPLALGRWRCLDADRPAARLGPQGRTYQATIAVRGVRGTCTAAAQGPLAALTTMLYERGITLEILGFHQLRCGAETATFIHGSNGQGSAWAMGFATDPGRSALEAVITCANRLLAVQ